MRLIDADKLAVDEVVSIYLKGVQEHFGLFSYPKCEIDEAPTVKAIPIEWIRQWYKSREYLTEGKTAICRMIWDWEKENANTN